jgi:hypothetical protein
VNALGLLREGALQLMPVAPARGLDIRDWATIASVCIAFTALVISVINVRTARNAFRLAQRQDSLRQPNLTLYLADAVSARMKGETYRIVACSIVVTNPSDSANSIAAADLQVTYTTDQNQVITLRVPHVTSVELDSKLPGESLAIPTPLPAHGSVAGVVNFRIDDGLIGTSRIDRYDLVTKDAHQIEESLQLVPFRDLVIG